MSLFKSAFAMILIATSPLLAASCSSQEASAPEKYVDTLGKAKKEAERVAEQAGKAAQKQLEQAQDNLNEANKNAGEGQD